MSSSSSRTVIGRLVGGCRLCCLDRIFFVVGVACCGPDRQDRCRVEDARSVGIEVVGRIDVELCRPRGQQVGRWGVVCVAVLGVGHGLASIVWIDRGISAFNARTT
jgi:hypothetical protein